ncbi:MAG: ATP-binding protein [Clostridiales bacterium]|nr:ATP-binding protein [Clostridiales bacterium]
MSYNRDNFIRVRKEFEEKAAKDREEADSRRAEIHEKLPEVRGIDAELMRISTDMVGAALGGQSARETVEALKARADSLRSARDEILVRNGYPSDYTSVRYECEKCRDTGFDGVYVCSCMKRRLILAEYESSGIGSLMKTQSFDTFDLSYYGGGTDVSRRMAYLFSECVDYAKNFDPKTSPNLLMIGATGLGKTHISTSIAKAVIDRSFNVRYDTAQNVFADFEHERFDRNRYDDQTSPTAKYMEAELLIIDDLGTEMTNSFTVSCLYNLINTRVNSGLPMIINTNLSMDELRKRYSDRIASRLFGEFRPLMFVGDDIRMQKLKQ